MTTPPAESIGVTRILETVLYGPDLAALRSFYEDVVGLRLVSGLSPRGVAFRVSHEALLLVFQTDLALDAPGGIPPHGAAGPGHIAFGVPPRSLGEMRAHLVRRGLAIEHEQTWSNGARSIYVRDPAGNSVEFVEGDLWPA